MPVPLPKASPGARAFLAGGAVAALLLLSTVVDAIPASRRRGHPVGADAPAYARIARVMLETGGIELPPPDRIDPDPQQRLADPFGTPYAVGSDGRLLPKHPWAYALLLAPGLAAAGADGFELVAGLLGALLAFLVTVRVARDLGALPAFLASLGLFVLSPGGRWVATAVNVDVALALGLALAFAFARDGRPLLAGAVAGFVPFLRPTAPLLFAALPLVLWKRGRLRALATAATGALPGLILFALQNALLWGAAWVTAYQRSAVVVDGKLVLASHADSLGLPTAKGLAALLFLPPNGFLAATPVAGFALLGFFLPRARATEWGPAAAGAGAALLLLSGYGFVVEQAAGAFRFGFPLLACAVAPLAALLREGADLAARRRAPSAKR